MLGRTLGERGPLCSSRSGIVVTRASGVCVMSDSEQRQLHVPYREYHSQNNTSPATTAAAATAAAALVETDALVDLSIAPPVSSHHHQRLSLPNDQPPSPADLLPDVEFIPGLSNDQTLAIDSSGIDRESQPLLGRLELDVTFNRFPGSSRLRDNGVPLPPMYIH